MRFAVVLMLLFSINVHAIQRASTFREVKEKIDQENKKIVEAEVKKRGILGTLYEINKNISRVTQDMKGVESRLAKARKQISSDAKSIVVLEDRQVTKRNLLRERLRSLYKMGLKGYAQVLMSSHSSFEMSRNYKFLQIIAKKDLELIKSYQINLAQLSKSQKALREKVRNFAELKANLEKEQVYYQTQKDAQNFILQQIEKDKESHLMALKEWREEGRDLEKRLKSFGETEAYVRDITRPGFFEEKGLLRVPVLGPIIQKYGMMSHSRFKTKIFHKGVFWGVKANEKVVASYWGKVAFAGWINGYGETVILDHGDHYYSLYAHNSKVLKKQGEQVSSGEVISYSGDTGSLRGPGLYFEIRHFSESLDPSSWLDLSTSRQL